MERQKNYGKYGTDWIWGRGSCIWGLRERIGYMSLVSQNWQKIYQAKDVSSEP